MKTISNCPFCGNSNQLPVYQRCRDYLVSGEVFSIVRCIDCDVLLTNPQPDFGNEASSYYDSPDYISHTDHRRGFLDKGYHVVKRFMIRRKSAFLKKLFAGAKPRLLDVGCGTGAFIEAAQKSGFVGEGLEVDSVARERAQQKGLPVYARIDELVADENAKYDFITLWHVLEHIHDVSEVLTILNNKLQPGGFLVIAVPMHTSLDAAKYGTYWAAWDVPRHLYHFNRQSLIHVCQTHGFTYHSRKGLLFDSFYVSILSEYNKIKEKQNRVKRPKIAPTARIIIFVEAFFTGLFSNLLAMAGKRPWSSEIIVFKR